MLALDCSPPKLPPIHHKLKHVPALTNGIDTLQHWSVLIAEDFQKSVSL